MTPLSGEVHEGAFRPHRTSIEPSGEEVFVDLDDPIRASDLDNNPVSIISSVRR
jgi:hypothetical protein